MEKDLQHRLPCETDSLDSIADQLMRLRTEMLSMESRYDGWDKIHPHHLRSARNLIHYMALRRYDVRELQIALSEWGLSSLGRAERKVQATVDTLLHVIHALRGETWSPTEDPPACFREGRRLLEHNTASLLGDIPSGRRVRIMVTMPGTAADDYGLVADLLQQGMNCARINCAHDHPAVWEKIVGNIRRASDVMGIPCKILMDLGGPKLRTGTVEPGPPVLRMRPERNDVGKVTAPARLWLYPAEHGQSDKPDPQGSLPLPGDWLAQCKRGDTILLTDGRGSKRRLQVDTVTEKAVLVTCRKTVYFVPGTQLQLVTTGKRKPKNRNVRLVADLPRKEGGIRLSAGDLLVLSADGHPGTNARFDPDTNEWHPATIGCSIPAIFPHLQIGEPIWFDDGKIGGTIEAVRTDRVEVRINRTRPGGGRLRAEKGINLPDSQLDLPALTEDDANDLPFVVKHADMVGLSFVNTPRDVDRLVEQLRTLTDNPPAIVLKVETRRGFDNLPAMLLTAMQLPTAGVMIARGDLAIECGFGRLAEVQEQILWLCEAAHLPAIWATQVLEGMARQGLPSRAEITDAAMGQRSECIMLNKGEHIVAATHALDDILRRMQDHQTKKRALLRKLLLSEKFFQSWSPTASSK
jgi:pyruvate kinase